MRYTKALKGSINFKRAIRQGNYCSGPIMVVYTHMLKDKSTNYLGICVSKKNGNSVERNKMKRWAKEIYKEIEGKFKKGYNIVVLYKKSVKMEEIQFITVKLELIRLFEQLNLINE